MSNKLLQAGLLLALAVLIGGFVYAVFFNTAPLEIYADRMRINFYADKSVNFSLQALDMAPLMIGTTAIPLLIGLAFGGALYYNSPAQTPSQPAGKSNKLIVTGLVLALAVLTMSLFYAVFLSPHPFEVYANQYAVVVYPGKYVRFDLQTTGLMPTMMGMATVPLLIGVMFGYALRHYTAIPQLPAQGFQPAYA